MAPVMNMSGRPSDKKANLDAERVVSLHADVRDDMLRVGTNEPFFPSLSLKQFAVFMKI